jgi:hypothetical protein
MRIYIYHCVHKFIHIFTLLYICIGIHQHNDNGLCVGIKMDGDVNKNRKCIHLSQRKGLQNNWIPNNSSDRTTKTCKVASESYLYIHLLNHDVCVYINMCIYIF